MQQYSLSVQTQRLGGLVIRIICTRNGPNLLLNSNKCRNHPRVQNLLLSLLLLSSREPSTFKTFLFIEEVHGSKCHINFSSVLSAFRKLTIREQSFQKRSLDWISLKHVTCYIFDDHTRPLIYLV